MPWSRLLKHTSRWGLVPLQSVRTLQSKPVILEKCPGTSGSMDSFRRDYYPKREIAVAASHTGNERKANNTAQSLQLLPILNTCCSVYLSLTDANSVTAALYWARGRFSFLGQEPVAKGGRKHRVRNVSRRL